MDPYLGEVRLFGGNYAPQDWVICDGRLLSVSQYQALYAVLGTRYGGDGVSTFGVPDLRGRLVVGDGQLTGGQNYTLGSTGGAEGVALTEANIPAHTHTFTVASSTGTVNTAANNFLGGATDSLHPSNTMRAYQAATAPNTPTAVEWANNAVSPSSGTPAAAHNNRQPFISLNYIMAVVGLFPQP